MLTLMQPKGNCSACKYWLEGYVPPVGWGWCQSPKRPRDIWGKHEDRGSDEPETHRTAGCSHYVERTGSDGTD